MLTLNPDRIVPIQALRTDEPADILDFAIAGLDEGIATALVTLVEVVHGAARLPGAQMAVRADGPYCGYVSGGCTEAAVAAEAIEALAEGRNRVVRFGAGSPFFDITLPCGGGIALDIRPLSSAAALKAVRQSLLSRRCATLCLAADGDVTTGHADRRTGWQDEGFTIAYRPEVRVVIGGRGLEAETVSALALASGYLVSFADGRSEIDADTAVVLLNHDVEKDLPVLQKALDGQPFYLGALGSRRTHDRRVEALLDQGYSEEAIARIKAPIGLFPKARDARSLALSILADIAAVRG